jgi:hypothetical protein
VLHANDSGGFPGRANVQVGGDPSALLADPDGPLYVASGATGRLTVLDASARRLRRLRTVRFPAAAGPVSLASGVLHHADATGGGLPTRPAGRADASVDHGRIYYADARGVFRVDPHRVHWGDRVCASRATTSRTGG